MAGTPRLVPIQALRSAAALLVAAGHGLHEGMLAGLAPEASSGFRLPWEAGVDVFFVISGFVMVVASGPLFGRRGAWRTFLARRIARIVPLYWIVSAVYLGIALATPSLVTGGAPGLGYVVASFLFWPAARPDGVAQPLYSLGWTLNLEMLFYGLFAVSLALGRLRAVAGVTAALGAIVVAGLSAPPLPLAAWGDPIVLEFAAGTGLGLAYAAGLRLPMAPRVALFCVGLAALAALSALPVLPRLVAFGVPAVLLVAACGLARPVPASAESALTRAAATLGDASYATYLIHPFVLRSIRLVAARAGLTESLGLPGFLLVGLAATLAASVLVYRWIERPLTRGLRRRLEP